VQSLTNMGYVFSIIGAPCNKVHICGAFIAYAHF
jgi:hypothetical protein